MPEPIVLDTNIVLDLLVFCDPSTVPLLQALNQGRLQWLATGAMRSELLRVLDYPALRPRLALQGLGVQSVAQRFDSMVYPCSVAPKASPTCKDPDDQPFIDLAVAHRAILLSKDRAVLQLARRLLAVGVWAGPLLPTLTAVATEPARG